MLAILEKNEKKVSDAIISWKLKQELGGCEKKSDFYLYLLHLRLISSLELFLNELYILILSYISLAVSWLQILQSWSAFMLQFYWDYVFVQVWLQVSILRSYKK